MNYGDIQITTTAAKKNASLNLLNLDLKINGVDRVNLSNSQYVFIKPRCSI